MRKAGAVEVLHRKQVGSSFGGGSDNFRRVGFDEALGNEVLSPKLKHLPAQPEHGVDVRTPKVKEAVVKSRVQFSVDRVRDAQRQGSLRPGDDVHRGGQHLVGGGGVGSPSLTLGGRLRATVPVNCRVDSRVIR